MADHIDRSSRRIRSAYLAASVALSLAAGGAASVARADGTLQPQTYAHSLAKAQRVLLDVTQDIKADVHVVAWDEQKVEIVVTPYGSNADRVRLRGSNEAGTMAMHVTAAPTHKWFAGWLSFYRPDAHIDMHVPRAATLSVDVVNGPIVIDNIIGELRVSLVNGPITVTGAGTLLYLTTVNGPIEAEIAKITAQPNITLSTTNGPVDLVVPAGFRASVHASTVLGPVENSLKNADGPGSVSMETVNGPVTISYH